MTIQRRLSASFLIILILFAINLVIYFWGSQRRQASVEALRRAASRQGIISTINQNLSDVQKQVTLLSQVSADSPEAPDLADVVQFNRQLLNIQREVGALRDSAEPDNFANIAAFAEAYRNLSDSWKVFYENLGVDQAKAITELVIHAEPAAQEVIRQRLPQLQRDENARVDAAIANFYSVATLTDRTAVIIFAISATVAIVVGLVVSRQLTGGLSRLEERAASIGHGNLNQRIDIQGNDELAHLGKAFNEMTERLEIAHEQLTRANKLEKEKSEELERILDQLQKTQDQLVVQQKLASLGSLTAGIAHEIKNPLNFVTNFAEISAGLADELRDSLKAPAERLDPAELEDIEEILQSLEQSVAKIQEHGKRADGIVRNMLVHSRGQTGRREMANLNSLVSDYIKLAYHGMRAQNQDFNVEIQEDLDASLQPVSVVAHDLSRAFLNLANNACYAAYEKKRSRADGFVPVVKVRTADLGSHVEVGIWDNGDGIPESIQKRVFEPFFTTKPAGSGTGLGLSMAYEIVVQLHKGQIRVESEPGKYAEFIVTLPRTASQEGSS